MFWYLMYIIANYASFLCLDYSLYAYLFGKMPQSIQVLCLLFIYVVNQDLTQIKHMNILFALWLFGLLEIQ